MGEKTKTYYTTMEKDEFMHFMADGHALRGYPRHLSDARRFFDSWESAINATYIDDTEDNYFAVGLNFHEDRMRLIGYTEPGDETGALISNLDEVEPRMRNAYVRVYRAKGDVQITNGNGEGLIKLDPTEPMQVVWGNYMD